MPGRRDPDDLEEGALAPRQMRPLAAVAHAFNPKEPETDSYRETLS